MQMYDFALAISCHELINSTVAKYFITLHCTLMPFYKILFVFGKFIENQFANEHYQACENFLKFGTGFDNALILTQATITTLSYINSDTS